MSLSSVSFVLVTPFVWLVDRSGVLRNLVSNKMRTWLCAILLTFSCMERCTSLNWIDYSEDEVDLFFDRIVEIVYIDREKKTASNIAIGVLVSGMHVLAPYAPFRNYGNDPNMLSEIRVNILYKRIFDNNEIKSYILLKKKITCAKQVILNTTPTKYYNELYKKYRNKTLPDRNAVGQTGISELFVDDLILIRLQSNILFADPREVSEDIYNSDVHGTKYILLAGPLLSILAESDMKLGKSMKFATIAHFHDIKNKNKEHYYLMARQFGIEDEFLVKCKDWLPETEGHFICMLKTEDDYDDITAGAILEYNGLIFGVGSHRVQKDNTTIIVFTDVRPYGDAIFDTCPNDYKHALNLNEN